ncbi:hypothetical protein BH24ACT5_BH24ACT5_15600 [soil metagenome]
MERARDLERRWREDGLIGADASDLSIMVGDGDTCAGVVEWRPVGRTGNYEIGIALFPDSRGRGIGTEAQRLVVEYLFNTTTAHRIQAGTEVDNVAEQKALENIGFQREGVNRGHHFRGEWRDAVMYALAGRGAHRTRAAAYPHRTGITPRVRALHRRLGGGLLSTSTTSDTSDCVAARDKSSSKLSELAPRAS